MSCKLLCTSRFDCIGMNNCYAYACWKEEQEEIIAEKKLLLHKTNHRERYSKLEWTDLYITKYFGSVIKTKRVIRNINNKRYTSCSVFFQMSAVARGFKYKKKGFFYFINELLRLYPDMDEEKIKKQYPYFYYATNFLELCLNNLDASDLKEITKKTGYKTKLQRAYSRKRNNVIINATNYLVEKGLISNLDKEAIFFIHAIPFCRKT